MKKRKCLLLVMKYILLAIILGGILGNLVCILEFLPPIANDDAPLILSNDFIPRLIIIIVVSWLAFYFLFMRSGKAIYALVFIPSEYIMGLISVDFWWKIFESSADAKGIFYARAGVLLLLIPSMFVCVLLIVVVGLFRFIWARKRKHL